MTEKRNVRTMNSLNLKYQSPSEIPIGSTAEIISLLREGREDIVVRQSHPSAMSYLIARLFRELQGQILVVTASDLEARQFGESLSFFCGGAKSRDNRLQDQAIWTFPSRSGRKAQSLGKLESTANRLAALYALRMSNAPTIVVTSALALMERLLPEEVFSKAVDYRVVGETIDLDQFCRQLTERGYFRVPLVEEHGDFSRRGGVVDLYSPWYEWPLRLEFFGDELESIRLFHPVTQRSMRTMEDAIILPASEVILEAAARERAQQNLYRDVEQQRLTLAAAGVWLERLQEGHQASAFEELLTAFYEDTANLSDYLDPQTLIVLTDAGRVYQEMQERYWNLQQEWESRHTPHEWLRPPAEWLQEPTLVQQVLERFRKVMVNPPLEGDSSLRRQGASIALDCQGQDALVAEVRNHPNRERLLEPVAYQFKRWREEGLRSYLVCRSREQARRLVQLLDDYGVEVILSTERFAEDSFDATAVKVLVGELARGFLWPSEQLAVTCDEELFGKRRSHVRKKTSVAGLFLNSFQDLHLEDLVVHVDHGIGVYKGLLHLAVQDIENDFLWLEYQGGDRLYVPVDKLQKIQKYLGMEGHAPNVDRLGGRSWETAKQKARESAREIARELLQLYALRQVRDGLRFSPPDSLYREFEATFTYEETPDQQQAIEEVLADMISSRPMDRLICGDVGYGKTEVALRAAFKAVMDGKQVAMLVPTTVLAEQHFQTFAERFSGFPIEVASLSRFKSAAQQRKVLEGLQKGTIDLVVGTHRLLQKDVKFRELGLLIIDEEHRFGVKHKERMKELRVSVDVLTLTATPIPRTLHMALTGIRDLSTIETPPQDRRAIETFVCKYDEFTIREAIYRELQRGGQVFFVHNHVQSIYQMAAQLNRLVPEARFGVAHGQLQERELEKIMMEFVTQQLDILVCTTIIESGLDIPAANTIIINRADKFGLAQIYQLRGRVGRSAEQAYAYLLIPGEYLITRDAQKRLRALMDFSELGAGFKIALNDLQIRGGGSILGAAQSGHIAAVGYELYLELLERTVRELKGETMEEAVDPEINVPVSAFLPDSFMTVGEQRLLAYKRLATAADETDIDDLAIEWRDRFGPLPLPVKTLVLLAKIRLLLVRMRVVRLDGDQRGFALRFAADSPVTEPTMASYAMRQVRGVQVEVTDRRLFIEVAGSDMSKRLARFRIVLQELYEHARGHEINQ
ncbi:MAG TPA: transcription-repair coupling factor [Syntrophobacteraceae bacterium]|nr:transcription-repair coupling factor [Syntrophobacteraceae bacterium]